MAIAEPALVGTLLSVTHPGIQEALPVIKCPSLCFEIDFRIRPVYVSYAAVLGTGFLHDDLSVLLKQPGIYYLHALGTEGTEGFRKAFGQGVDRGPAKRGFCPC
jgi:hypothetical protein